MKWCMIIVLWLEIVGGVESKSRNFMVTVKKKRVENNFIKLNPFGDAITQSVEMALENCQKLFQWDRWNCPMEDFLAKRASYSLDREGAFVQAITVAALIYTVTKNCSRGEINSCGCNFERLNDGKFQIIDCSDQLEYGENMAELLLANPEHYNLDVQGYAEVHNTRAGRIAVRNSLRRHCRCHGLSGSCSMQTCWTLLNSFPEIASDIRKMYDHATLLLPDNSGRIDDSIDEESLVYLLESPNYCLRNAIPGWNGMRGRQCSRAKENAESLQERRSCQTLCKTCGLRVKKDQQIRKRRCNCKFNWCCDVTCEVCTDVINEYFCD